MELGAGSINITVRPADQYDFSQNLDVAIRLLNSSGVEVATADGNGFDASTIIEDVVAGTYYLEIDGVGNGNPLTNGYSDYGTVPETKN